MGAQTNVAPVIIKRKKAGGGEGHHGGAWKVAYADFVTAMMAFFMLMWLLNATTEKQRKGLADYFSPSVPMSRVSSGSDGALGGESVFSEETLLNDGTGGSAERALESRQSRGDLGVDPRIEQLEESDPLKKIEEALNGRGGESYVTDEALKHVVTRVTDEGLIVELFARPGAPLFEKGTDTPTRLMRDLTAMVSRVAGLVENGIAIGGHVRSSPMVLTENPVWDLSSARAARSRALLEAGGTAPRRIQRVTGHADRKPSHTDPMALRNNRIEITLLRDARK